MVIFVSHLQWQARCVNEFRRPHAAHALTTNLRPLRQHDHLDAAGRDCGGGEVGGTGLFAPEGAHRGGAGLLAALAIAIFAYGMPASMAGNAALFGGLTGLLPIGWIVLNIIFLHQLTEQNGSFKILQDSIAGITKDRRLQLLLIAFAFGAFFEGAAGFGTPVAVTAALLIGLGLASVFRRSPHRA